MANRNRSVATPRRGSDELGSPIVLVKGGYVFVCIVRSTKRMNVDQKTILPQSRLSLRDFGIYMKWLASYARMRTLQNSLRIETKPLLNLQL